MGRSQLSPKASTRRLNGPQTFRVGIQNPFSIGTFRETWMEFFRFRPDDGLKQRHGDALRGGNAGGNHELSLIKHGVFPGLRVEFVTASGRPQPRSQDGCNLSSSWLFFKLAQPIAKTVLLRRHRP